MRRLVTVCAALFMVAMWGLVSAAPDTVSFNHNATAFPLAGAHSRTTCESCHIQGVFRGTPQTCSGCHISGGRAPGKPVSHIATQVACEACHATSAWTPSSFKHLPTQGVTAGSCATCHNGLGAPGKSANHIDTTASCDTCHTSRSTFSVAKFDHARVTPPVAGRCASCHDNKKQPGKPASHPVTSAQCDTCHSTTSSWAASAFDHLSASPPVAGRCISCHNGSKALGKPSSHIPTAAQCDTCHKNFKAFGPALMSHAATVGPVAAKNCSTCHNGSYLAQNAQAKPPTHIATTAQCDTCHSSTTSWATATFNHATASPPVAGRCANCHNSTAALGKPSTHIPTNAQCDTCHTNFSAFKPAKMDHSGVGACSTCHNGSYTYANALGKPVSHIPTSASCESCHKNFTAFSPASMNHAGLAGQCASCHNGAYLAQNAQAKPATHIATTAQCDTCHTSTTSWATATFNHATASPPVAGRCATCHNSTTALGKPSTHIPTSAQCDTCHKSFTAFAPATMNHSGTTGPTVAGNCATCHSGTYKSQNALAKPASHIPTTSQCDSCHKSYTAFAPASMNHSGLAGQCSTCHNGSYLAQNAQAKPPTHIATTAQCDTCHSSTTSWATATFNHATASPPVAGRCATCHNSTTALGKPSTHVPTSAQCDTCHKNFTAFAPATMSHSGTTGPSAAGNCASCHNGSYTSQNALAKPVTHIPTTAQCDTCHKSTTAFAPASMSHGGTTGPAATGNCATCHSGTYTAQGAQAKPVTHISTTAQCDTCHTSTTSWATATFNHATASPPVAGRCTTCHNGTTALGKPSTHIPTSAQCDTCHKSTTAFAPATMSHSGTTGPSAAGNCATCHNGSYTAQNALAKPVTHIPTTAQCDTCHKSTTAFAPAAMSHSGTTGPAAAGNCSTCHSGSYTAQGAQTKPATHIATTAQCDTCHTSTTSWATATFNHATASPPVAGRCSTCHNGTTALGKPSTHIPSSAQCDTCHKNTTAFAPATMNHAGTTGPAAAGNCSSCHNGSYTAQNALAKPVTHIPTTAQCDTCHKSTTAFAPATMSHSGTSGPTAAGNCSTCHSGAYTAQGAQAKPVTHISTTAQCDTCHTSTTTWSAATFNHATASPPVAGRCSTCHNGTTALGKPGTHIPTSAQCDTCHKSTTAFAPATMSHSGTTGPVAAGNCSSCHNGSYTAQNALAKPVTHIPTSAQCDTCHKSTTAFAPATMSHSGTTGPTAAGNCSTCHSGAYTSQGAQTKPVTHISTTAQCDTCHTSTTTWSAATFNHATASPPVAGRCSSCHNGTTALGKPGTHIPTSAQCDTCHKSTTTFAPATMSHSGTTGPVAAGNCSTCHNGAYLAANALAKPAIHIPTTSQCDVCHKSTTAFAPATMNHSSTTGPTAAGNCSSCHNGSYVSQNALAKPVTHIPTTAQCDVCHKSTTAFAPATMSHSGTTGPIATGNCATCHNGTYVAAGAITKPSNHIPTTSPAGAKGNECSYCHSSTTSFGVEKMNHGTMQTSCVTCHDSSSPYAGSMEKINRANHETGSATKDCSSSGCHRPLGSKGTPYSKWD